MLVWVLLALSTLTTRTTAATPAISSKEIVDELQTFLDTLVEPNLIQYMEWKRQDAIQNNYANSVIGKDCLEDAPGRYLRHRCCVVYSNLAAAMLYAKYGVPTATAGEHDDLKNLRDYHSTRQQDFHPQELEILLRLWAVNSDQRRGIYKAPLIVQGVELELAKCEFLETHTFLRLSNQSMELVVDMSWKQIVLMSIMQDEMEPKAKDQASIDLYKVMEEEPNSLVFSLPDATTVFDAHKFQNFLKQAKIWHDQDHAAIFPSLHGMILGMYSSNFLNNICGKTSAEIMQQEQERKEQAAKIKQLQERIQLLQNLELPPDPNRSSRMQEVEQRRAMMNLLQDLQVTQPQRKGQLPSDDDKAREEL